MYQLESIFIMLNSKFKMNYNYRLTFYVFLLFGALTIGCQSEKNTITPIKYFAHLPGIISSYLPYTPTGEITLKMASSLSHYKVEYDERNRIQSIAYFKGETPSNDAYYRTHKVTYSFEDGKMSRSYFDTNMEKSYMWRHYYEGGDVHEEIFELNNNGNRIKLTFLDSLNQQAENGTGTTYYTWEKLDDKSVIQRHYKKDGSSSVYRQAVPFEIVKITVDENGYSKYLTNINELGEVIKNQEYGYATLEIYFDEYGNEMGWAHLDEKGVLTNLKKEEDFGHSQWLFKKEWRNRKLGLVASYVENFYDKDSIPLANNDGVHEVRYVLNEYGDLKSMEYYNLNGEKHTHGTRGFFRAEATYNDSKERIEVVKYDTLGTVIEE